MIALLLQLVGLVLLPVGGFLAAGVGGAVVGLAVVFVFVGLAIERGS